MINRAGTKETASARFAARRQLNGTGAQPESYGLLCRANACGELLDGYWRTLRVIATAARAVPTRTACSVLLLIRNYLHRNNLKVVTYALRLFDVVQFTSVVNRSLDHMLKILAG
jgi:hypothetical protein